MERKLNQQAAVAPNRDLRWPDDMQPREAFAPPPPQQRKCKAPTALEERGKAPVGEQTEDIRNEGVLPQREPETKRVDPNFSHYIRPRRTNA